MDKITIIIGLPGSQFSSKFLIDWTETLFTLWKTNKYNVIMAPGESSFVTFARMKTLGLDVLRGVDQKPFGGTNYDIFVTLDSDMHFTPNQFLKLIEQVQKHKVVAGYYMMDNQEHLAVVRDWNEDYFIQNGSFRFLTPHQIEEWKQTNPNQLMEVDYVGMGFMAITKEVLDKMKYPYFHRKLEKFKSNDKSIVSICSEDVAFCKNIKKAGYTVCIDPELRIGHEKKIVI
jgi:hypothetical protein